MGNASPFVEARSIFILGDKEVLTACNEVPGDACETPWDNCCDSKEDKKRGTATIQVVDANGRVLKEPVEGVGGLAKLAEVIGTGRVAEGSSAESLVVNATAIDVKERREMRFQTTPSTTHAPRVGMTHALKRPIASHEMGARRMKMKKVLRWTIGR